MTNKDDFWDTLADDLVELTPAQLQLQQAKMDNETRIERMHSEIRASRILRFIAANPHFSARDLVNKFYLDWELIRDFGNGIARIEFDTGGVVVMDLHLPIKEWFRD